MSIQFPCVACQAMLKVKNELAGRRVRCKKCGTALRVPDTGSEPAGEQQPRSPTSGPRPDTPASHFDDIPLMPVETKKCPDCGAWIDSGAAKCRHCNTHFDESGQPVRRKRVRRRRQERLVVGEVLFASWQLFKEEWITGVLVYLVASFIITAVVFVPLICLGLAAPMRAGAAPGDAPPAPGFGQTMVVLALLVAYWLLIVGVGTFVNCGLANVFLRIAKGDRASLDDFWNAQYFFLNFLVNYFAFSVIVAIGTLLFVLPGLLAILILWPVFFTSVDEMGSGFDPLIRAYDVGKKNILPSLGLISLAFLFLVLGELMCGVGVLVAMPLDMLMFAVAYCMMTGQWTERASDE